MKILIIASLVLATFAVHADSVELSGRTLGEAVSLGNCSIEVTETLLLGKLQKTVKAGNIALTVLRENERVLRFSAGRQIKIAQLDRNYIVFGDRAFHYAKELRQHAPAITNMLVERFEELSENKLKVVCVDDEPVES